MNRYRRDATRPAAAPDDGTTRPRFRGKEWAALSTTSISFRLSLNISFKIVLPAAKTFAARYSRSVDVEHDWSDFDYAPLSLFQKGKVNFIIFGK